MSERDEQVAEELYQDHLDRMAEDHVLREEEAGWPEELRRKTLEGYKRTTHDFAVALADAAYHKHGNYPAALIDVCSALVMFHGEKVINDLVEVVYREKAEEEASPF